MVTLDTLLRISGGTCPMHVGTIKGVLRKPPGLSRKQPSPSFRVSAMYCLLSRQRWDLVMLTLLLKWPPAGLPFTALWWNPVPPFIPTCALQIFKLGLHKHCYAGEMIPNAAWSEPALNLCSIGQMWPSQTHHQLFIMLMNCLCMICVPLPCKLTTAMSPGIWGDGRNCFSNFWNSTVSAWKVYKSDRWCYILVD